MHTTIFVAEIYDRQNCVMYAPITFLSFNLKTIKLILKKFKKQQEEEREHTKTENGQKSQARLARTILRVLSAFQLSIAAEILETNRQDHKTEFSGDLRFCRPIPLYSASW